MKFSVERLPNTFWGRETKSAFHEVLLPHQKLHLLVRAARRRSPVLASSVVVLFRRVKTAWEYNGAVVVFVIKRQLELKMRFKK